MDRLASQIVAQIIRKGLHLPPRNVWLRDQNRDVPTDEGVYVIVGLVNAAAVAAETYIRQAQQQDWDSKNGRWDVPGQSFDFGGQVENYDNGDAWDRKGQTFDEQPVTVFEVSRVQQRENIQIDFLSRGNDGIRRTWEVLAALRSIYSQQLQEQYNFKIMRVQQSFINTSSAEGSSFVNRYSITIPCFVWYQKTTVLPSDGEKYFDSFGLKVYVEKPTVPFAPDHFDQGGDWDDGPGRFDLPAPPPADPGLEVIVDIDITQQGIAP